MPGPLWDAFLSDSDPESTSWFWPSPGWPSPTWPSPASCANVALAVLPMLVPLAVWLTLDRLRRRAQSSLRASRKLLRLEKSKLTDYHFDPNIHRCLLGIQRDEKEFQKLVQTCERERKKYPAKTVLGFGDISDPDRLSDTSLPSSAAEDSRKEYQQAYQKEVAAEKDLQREVQSNEQGLWYRDAPHGLCIMPIEDSSDEDDDVVEGDLEDLEDDEDEMEYSWRRELEEQELRQQDNPR